MFMVHVSNNFSSFGNLRRSKILLARSTPSPVKSAPRFQPWRTISNDSASTCCSCCNCQIVVTKCAHVSQNLSEISHWQLVWNLVVLRLFFGRARSYAARLFRGWLFDPGRGGTGARFADLSGHWLCSFPRKRSKAWNHNIFAGATQIRDSNAIAFHAFHMFLGCKFYDVLWYYI